MRPKRRRSPSRSPSPRRNATASTSTARPPATPSPSRSHRGGGWTPSLSFPRLNGRRSQNNTRGRRSANTPPLPSSLPAAAPVPSSSSASSSAFPPQSIQPTKSSTKVAAAVIWDVFNEALRVAKESSDWNPILKAALGGAVAVIDLGKKVNSNWSEMEVLVTRIEGLQPILEMRMKTPRVGENWSSGYVEKCAQTLEREVSKIKEMQTHGLIRRTMQGTRDGDRLLGVYKCIKETLDDLQYTVGLSIERDTSTIRQSVALKELPISVTAPHNAAIDHTTVSRRACTKDTRLAVIEPILSWISGPKSPPVYWLTGPAGVGKTTIAQTICEYVDPPTDEDVVLKELVERRLVSYFCSRQLDSGESKRLVPTLCRRLAEHSSSYARELVRALETNSTLPHAKLRAQIEGLLVKPWASSSTQRESLPLPIIVVDALDENDSGFEFLDLLLNAVDGHKFDGLRFLLTSRTDPDIERRCQSFPKDAVCRLQEVPKADVQHDITLYLEASLPEVKDELRRDLATRAGNLFIYASTVVKMTSKTWGSEQERIIKTVLDATTLGRLDDLYAGIVHLAIYHEDEHIRRDRLRTLHTILIRIHNDYWVPPSKHVIPQLTGTHEDVLSAVVDGLHAVMYTAKDGSILTYHASFPDFILRSPSSLSSSVYLNPLCDEGLHHAHLTRRCYEIMAERLHFNMCNLESSFDLDEDIPDLKSRYETNIDPVLQYAVQYWMEHLQHSRPDEDNQGSIPLCDIPLAFIDNIFLYWLEEANLLWGRTEFLFYTMGSDWIQKHCPEHIKIWDEMNRFCVLYKEMPLQSTPHIYLSILSLWKPESRISRVWRPRFPHLPNVALDGQRNPTDITGRELGPQNSQGYTDTGDDNNLVGVPPRRLDCDTGWVLSEDGYRIMRLPHESNQNYMMLPAPDQISFDLQYLGPNWTRIYDPPSSQ